MPINSLLILLTSIWIYLDPEVNSMLLCGRNILKLCFKIIGLLNLVNIPLMAFHQNLDYRNKYYDCKT